MTKFSFSYLLVTQSPNTGTREGFNTRVVVGRERLVGRNQSIALAEKKKKKNKPRNLEALYDLVLFCISRSLVALTQCYFKEACCCSIAQSCPTLCDPIDCSTTGHPVHHQLPEFTHTHVHWLCDAIQQSHPLSAPFPLAFNLSQHQNLFKWVSSSHWVAKVLEFQLQHQSL